MPRKKFKKYHVPPAQGKGSDRREPQVSEQQLAENWCAAFGHQFRFDPDICDNCHQDKMALKGSG